MSLDLTSIKNNILQIQEYMKTLTPAVSSLTEKVKEVESQYSSMGNTVNQVVQDNVKFMQQYKTTINDLTTTLQQQQNIETTISNQRQETQEDISKLTDKVNNLVSSFGNVNAATQSFETAQRNMESVVQSTTVGIETQIDALKIAMQQAVNTANSTDAAGMLESQRKRRIEMDKLIDKYGHLAEAAEEENKGLDVRQRIMSATIKEITDQTGDRKLPFFEGLSVYLEKGGTSAEYLAQFLTSTREELKIFGVEVASVRKFMYGFLPPGTFRLVNKFSTALNFVGGTMRSLQADAENTGNIITKTLFAGSLDKRGIRKLTQKKKGIDKDLRKMTAQMENAERKSKDSTRTVQDQKDFQEQAEYLKELIKVTEEEQEKAESRLKKLQGGIAAKLFKGKFNPARIGLGISQSIGAKMDEVNEKLNEKIKNSTTWTEAFLPRAAKAAISLTRFILVASMYFILFALVFIVIKKFITTNGKLMKKIFDKFIPTIQRGLMTAWEGIQMIFGGFMDIITGVLNGDLGKIWEGIKDVGLGLLYVIWGVFKAFATVAFALVWTPIETIGRRVIAWFSDWTWDNLANKLGTLIGIAIAIVATLTLLSLLPVQLPLIAVAALTYVMYKGLSLLGDKIGLWANGGTINTPISIVGEKGPELMFGKQGSTVVSNANSKKMLKGSGGGTVNNFNITVNAKDSSKAEMRRMADEIGRMISSKINRSTSSSTLR